MPTGVFPGHARWLGRAATWSQHRSPSARRTQRSTPHRRQPRRFSPADTSTRASSHARVTVSLVLCVCVCDACSESQQSACRRPHSAPLVAGVPSAHCARSAAARSSSLEPEPADADERTLRRPRCADSGVRQLIVAESPPVRASDRGWLAREGSRKRSRRGVALDRLPC